MTYIPKGFCRECGGQFRIKKNGHQLEVETNSGRPYYRIRCDAYECTCGRVIFLGFGEPVFPHDGEHWTKAEPDETVRLD